MQAAQPQIHWLNRLLNHLFGPRFKSEYFEEQIFASPEESTGNDRLADDSMSYHDIGADLGSEFLENPGTVFWLVDGAYRRIEKLCCGITELVSTKSSLGNKL